MSDLSIATRWFADQRRALIGWTLGAVALIMIIVATYPAIRDSPELSSFVEDLPEFMRAIVGEEITSPAGYLGARLFSTSLPVLLLIYLIGRATNAIAGDERDGKLELLLSEPITRRRVVLQRGLALAVAAIVICAASWVTIVVGGLPVDLGLPAGDVVAALVSTLLLGLAHAAVALAVGAGSGSKGAATGAAAVVAFAGWLLYGLAPMVDVIEDVVWLSPWHHALAADPIRDGFDAGGSLVLTAIVAVATVVAIWGFDRRDVGV
ncbi:MAG: ABC transporter permease [Actinobacteria bacterium]|nr:ABC transporter permease [Actinomycetota bacterium]